MCHALCAHAAPASDAGEAPKPAAALRGPEAERWLAAIEAEVQQLLARGTWELVPHADVPAGKSMTSHHVHSTHTSYFHLSILVCTWHLIHVESSHLS